ncbi:N-acetylglucosamine kinase-like BadF-type ATPase [Filimonas zeae]|uniref:ATPase n=1 Tax=Filimonas zeae TaxID=1737353 RepID=A0A917MWF6_9BACT|nr:N-acetylglucosamine kinase [Filimonas zeae]MDR6338426.1 N-acetylglucosamine kinase-like BadF-type ATPase [Filimonas zeae]GGH68315.1 ATPase [Filimonas zeae]
MAVKLIADSGATKCEWQLLDEGKKKKILTQGISPYFLSGEQIVALLQKELLPKLKEVAVEEVYYYGTGLSNPNNVTIIKNALRQVFPKAHREVNHDMFGAARALCQHEKGMACILGTGSNVCFYNGKKIVKDSPGLGYVLGDEGSGAYLGRKVIQYFLYKTFDEELMARFQAKFNTNSVEILENVYKKPLPNRYLASFAEFLAENRGHYMVENIVEDGLNDFFFQHIYKFRESWTLPIHFTGSVAFGFKDVLKDLCGTYELELGTVLKNPMQGLIKFHS